MRVGAGLRNALLFLAAVVAAHVWLVRPDKVASTGNDTYGKTATAQRRAACRAGPPPLLQQQPPADPWPPTAPAKIDMDLFDTVYRNTDSIEEDERMALHRLVFSQPDPEDSLEFVKPRPMPDYSGLHMAAESGGLPMHYIRPDAIGDGNSDTVSGIFHWGAGYEPVAL